MRPKCQNKEVCLKDVSNLHISLLKLSNRSSPKSSFHPNHKKYLQHCRGNKNPHWGKGQPCSKHANHHRPTAKKDRARVTLPGAGRRVLWRLRKTEKTMLFSFLKEPGILQAEKCWMWKQTSNTTRFDCISPFKKFHQNEKIESFCRKASWKGISGCSRGRHMQTSGWVCFQESLQCMCLLFWALPTVSYI